MEATFLNRVIRWDPVLGRAELDADTRHVAMVLRDLGLAIATPAVTRVAKRPNADDAALHSRNASELLWTVGTCRMLQLSGTRDEKNPTTKDFEELERVGRHLRCRLIGAIRFGMRTSPGVMEVFCDVDHPRLGITQVPIANGWRVEVTLVEAW